MCDFHKKNGEKNRELKGGCKYYVELFNSLKKKLIKKDSNESMNCFSEKRKKRKKKHQNIRIELTEIVILFGEFHFVVFFFAWENIEFFFFVDD